jgi:hypothetical protein
MGPGDRAMIIGAVPTMVLQLQSQRGKGKDEGCHKRARDERKEFSLLNIIYILTNMPVCYNGWMYNLLHGIYNHSSERVCSLVVTIQKPQ